MKKDWIGLLKRHILQDHTHCPHCGHVVEGRVVRKSGMIVDKYAVMKTCVRCMRYREYDTLKREVKK